MPKVRATIQQLRDEIDKMDELRELKCRQMAAYLVVDFPPNIMDMDLAAINRLAAVKQYHHRYNEGHERFITLVEAKYVFDHLFGRGARHV